MQGNKLKHKDEHSIAESNNAEEMSQLNMTDIALKIISSVYLLQELDRVMRYDSWQLQQH